MAKFITLAAGVAMVAAGILLLPVSAGMSSFLISAGAGMTISGIGTLLSKGPLTGTSAATRNPVAPWNVIYGQAKVGGVMIYFSQFDDNNKYLDMVFVLACHACQSVDALLFDGQRIQMSTAGGGFTGIGDSFTPLQQTVSISRISRSNNVVTVVLLANIPLLLPGDNIIIEGVTGDLTLNGTFPVNAIISRTVGGPGAITFTYLSGGAAAIVDNEGSALTTWPDYGRKVHMEVLLGNHTETFPGMINGTANDGDTSDLIHFDANPWTAAHKCLGRTVVFLRMHYSDVYFASGLPAISFVVSGKKDILDPRTMAHGFSSNPALCIADYLANVAFGFRAAYSTEIPYPDLIASANVCDEASPLVSGDTELRYTLNGTFPLSLRRGGVLENLLTSCGGRLTTNGGQFKIHPAAWQGVSLDLGTGGLGGFFARAGANDVISLNTFDAIAPLGGTYPSNARWPDGCNVINYAALIALKPAGSTKPSFVQGTGNASAAGFGGGTFDTWTVAFARDTVAGNCLIVDVAFTSGYPLSAATVTDSQGNVYKLITGSHAPGSASFLGVFVATNCGAGPCVVTITQTGRNFTGTIFDFNTIATSIHEYSGLSGALPTGTQAAGANFGDTGPDVSGVVDAIVLQGGQDNNSINLELATGRDNDMLHFVTALLPDCGTGLTRAVVTGGPGAPLEILAIAAGPFKWRSKVGIRDLYNGVKGTFVSPSNKWQPTDFPPYAQDTLHGYASGSPLYPEGDANLAADGGDRRWLDIQLPFTISTSMAQRLAKIELMRRRQQGTGTFMYNMAMYRATALDITKMSLPLLGWNDKLLEITAHRFKLDKVQAAGKDVTLLGTEIDVQETSPTIYEWDVSEELTPQGYQQASMPTNVGTLTDLYTVNGT